MARLKQLYDYLAEVPSVFIDGVLYAIIGILAAVALTLNSDEAAKYIDPVVLFWFRSSIGWLNAGLLATKMYRSTQFADHQTAKKANGGTGHTAFLTKTETSTIK